MAIKALSNYQTILLNKQKSTHRYLRDHSAQQRVISQCLRRTISSTQMVPSTNKSLAATSLPTSSSALQLQLTRFELRFTLSNIIWTLFFFRCVSYDLRYSCEDVHAEIPSYGLEIVVLRDCLHFRQIMIWEFTVLIENASCCALPLISQYLYITILDDL